MFLPSLSGQRQTRGQEEKEKDMRGEELVHLTIFLGLWSVRHADSQTGSNFSMSTQLYN